MKNSRDEKELRHVWIQWFDKSGGPIKESYTKFVELSNRAAQMNSYVINVLTLNYFFD